MNYSTFTESFNYNCFSNANDDCNWCFFLSLCLFLAMCHVSECSWRLCV